MLMTSSWKYIKRYLCGFANGSLNEKASDDSTAVLGPPVLPGTARVGGSACRSGVRNGLGLSSYGSFHEHPLHMPSAPVSA
jgi:hypothetical protein